MSEQGINDQEPKTDIVVDYKFAAENSSVIDDMYEMIGDQYYEIPADERSNITADDGKHIHSPAAIPAHSYDNRINSGYADDSSATDGVRKQLGSCSDKVASQNAQQQQDAYVFHATCLQQAEVYLNPSPSTTDEPDCLEVDEKRSFYEGPSPTHYWFNEVYESSP